MKRIVTKGIVLSRTDFGEADRILNVLTPNFGKLKLMAKGVRRSKSKMAGGIELFSVGNLTIMPGKGEIDTLISSRLANYWGNIVQDIDRTMLGYQILNIIKRVTEDSSEQEYFDLVETALTGLNQLELDRRLLELWFIMQLLQLSGHGPNLKTTVSESRLKEAGSYNFDIDHMAFEVVKTGQFKDVHIKLLRLGRDLKNPQSLTKLRGTDKCIEAVLDISKTMAERYLNIQNLK